MMAFILSVLVLTAGCMAANDVRTCEPIKIKMCQGLGYDVTGRTPDHIRNNLQDDVHFTLMSFALLIQYGCADRLRFFLCSVYVPMCSEKVPDPIGPCRPLCEDVRDRCLPVFQQFGFPWPPALNCSKFPPEYDHHHMCMRGPLPRNVNPVDHRLFFIKVRTTVKKPTARPKYVNQPPRKPNITLSPHPHTYNYGLCDRFKKPELYYYVNRTGLCSHLCKADVIFTKEDKHFANIWIIVMAMFCFASTFVTFFAYVLNRSLFKFPEMPMSMIFISLSYCIYSGAYLVSTLSGRHNLACNPEAQWQQIQFLTRDSLDNSFCAIMFVVTYYFSTASEIWWVVLCFCWLLSAGRKWSHEDMKYENVRTAYFHIFSWGIPAILSVLAVVVHAVDADELTGMCSVGNHNATHFLLFVIIPNLTFLVLGIFIIYKVRRNREPYKFARANVVRASNRVDSHKVRLPAFFRIYIVLRCVLLGTYFYEYTFRETWWTVKGERPYMWILFLKITTCMFVGALPAFTFIWTKPICSTWKKIFHKPTDRTSNKPMHNTETETTHL